MKRFFTSDTKERFGRRYLLKSGNYRDKYNILLSKGRFLELTKEKFAENSFEDIQMFVFLLGILVNIKIYR